MFETGENIGSEHIDNATYKIAHQYILISMISNAPRVKSWDVQSKKNYLLLNETNTCILKTCIIVLSPIINFVHNLTLSESTPAQNSS